MITLYKYQEEYFKHVKPNYIYDMDTGTGKTIMGLEHHQKYFKDKKLVIVAPASKINEGGWQRTIAEHYPQIKYETCTYNMLNKNYKNYENYFVIFDECHRLKNSTGVWGKAGYNLTKICSGFILLSATPIPNGWEDSINYFKMFGLTKNKTQFIRNNAITSMEYGYLEIIGWQNETKLTNMWKSISRRLSKDEATDLPQLVFEDIHFKASLIYKVIKKNRIYDGILYDNQMKLRHGLRLNVNLKTKIEYIKEFVENTNDNIIIFYNYDEEFKLLKENIAKTTYVCNGAIKDYPKKEEWDNIKNTVTLANYKSGSEAVEFTYANIIVYFSPTESYTEFYQSYGRCYRNGQTQKVTAYKFVTDSTIEADIYKALDSKQDFNYNLWEKEKLNNG
ncbi:MAG: DNA helicase [Bacilli bacterium]|nr:DNA helicase [Bacilli bacterium]